jgi:predicted transposase YbfD/YdcC
VLFPLPKVLLVVLCATLAGAEDFVEIRRWGQMHQGFLRRLLPFKAGVPSHDTLNDVINAIDGALFAACFTAWVEGLRDPAAATATAPEIVAIDGKTSRRTHDHSKDRGPLHMVSAWASSQRLVLGQQACEAKSNEITAIPLLLERLALTGALVTIDAMGTQTKIAQTILDRGGDYLLALKDNQASLHDEISRYLDDPRAKIHSRFETTDGDHGRIEVRRHRVSHDMDWLTTSRRIPGEPRFPGLRDRRRRGRGRAKWQYQLGAALLFVLPAARRQAVRRRRAVPLACRKPPALGARCRVPRGSQPPAIRHRATEHGHCPSHGDELAPRPKRQAQPPSQAEISRMGHRLSRSITPPISVSALQAIPLPI